MFKHRVNGTSRDRVNRASSACVACPDSSPLDNTYFKMLQGAFSLCILLNCSTSIVNLSCQ